MGITLWVIQHNPKTEAFYFDFLAIVCLIYDFGGEEPVSIPASYLIFEIKVFMCQNKMQTIGSQSSLRLSDVKIKVAFTV